MRRRTFIAASSLAGLGACTDLNTKNKRSINSTIDYAEEQSFSLLKKLKNSSLTVNIYSNAYTEIIDKANNVKWESWEVGIQEKGQVEEGHVWLRTGRSIHETYPGSFQGKLEGANIRFTLVGRQHRIIGRFLCNISLEKDHLVYRILEIDDTIPSLSFPIPLKSDEIYIPKGVGEVVRETSNLMDSRIVYPFYTRLNMRFIGGQKNQSSWIGIFDEGFEDAYGLFVNRNASPLFARTLGKWKHGYSYRMKFMKGNYVNVAKTYRKWSIEHGLFKSLKDKMVENANLSSFLGGRAFWISLAFPKINEQTTKDFLLTKKQSLARGENDVNVRFTYSQLSDTINKLKKLGLKKGFVKIAGWINGGYDYSHQDTWPPEPLLGEISELKELLSMKGPLISGLHDNNQDIYAHTASFPKGVIRNANGELMTGGVWAGGQTYILGSRSSIDYAKRNWKNIKTLNPKSMFVDIITAMNLYQSYEQGNELTKGEDLQAKINLLKFYKAQGILLGSEESADFGIPYLDWYENRHRRIQGTSIPLWPLVFHDAAFNTRYGGVSHEGEYPGWMEDMLWGYLPHFNIGPDWNQERLFESIGHVDLWHEKVGMAEMINHQFLSDDFKVEKTEFSTGDAIICNFSNESFRHDGITISPVSYRTL